MKTVIFEITEKKTEMVIDEVRADITDTPLEKALVRQLKKMQEDSIAKQTMEYLDIDKWSVGG